MAARSCEEEIACPKTRSAVTAEGLSAPEMIHRIYAQSVNQTAPVRLKEEPSSLLFLF